MGLKYKIQRGLTLIELSIVLMLLAALAVVSTRFMFDEFDRSIADKTVAEMWAVAEYSVAYYSANNKWPDEDNSCASAPKVMADDSGLLKGIELEQPEIGGVKTTIGVYSPWSNSSGDKVKYVLSCDKNDTYKGFQISLTIPDFPGGASAAEWGQYMLQKLPLATLSNSGKSLTVTMPPPAGVVALRDYLLRKEDPKRPDLNAQGKESLNDLGKDAVININTNVVNAAGVPLATVERKIVDFDVDAPQDFNKDGVFNEHFNKNTAIYSLNMPRTSVLNKVVLIPTSTTGKPVTDADYHTANCRGGSPGGFALEICERDYDAHTEVEDVDPDIDALTNLTSEIINIAKDPQGSIKANDIYLESIGKWASEIDNEMIPNWMLVEHYKSKKNDDDINYTGCPSDRSAKYEIWPKKIQVDSRPGNTPNITYSNDHIFDVSDTGEISIYWPGVKTTTTTDAEGNTTTTEEDVKGDDNSSRVYANVYCVKT